MRNKNFPILQRPFFNLVNCLLLMLWVRMAEGSPGAASSVFSSRGGGGSNKNAKIDYLNNNNVNNNEDWYENSLTNNTQKAGEGNENSPAFPDEQVLISKLLKNYDPAARPVYNASKVVNVKFSFSLIQICDMVLNKINLRFF